MPKKNTTATTEPLTPMHPEDDTEFDHEVGEGYLESHRRGEARAFAEQGAGQSDRGVGAGRGGDAQSRRGCRRWR